MYFNKNWSEQSVLPPMTEQYTGHMIQTETLDKITGLPLVEVLVT